MVPTERKECLPHFQCSLQEETQGKKIKGGKKVKKEKGREEDF